LSYGGVTVEDETRQRCAMSVTGTFHLFMRTMGPEIGSRVGRVVHPRQFHTMVTLKNLDGASLSALAGHTGSTMSAASKLVDGLVDRGFVARETDEDDRRRLILRLTEAGEQLIAAVDDAETSALVEWLADLSDAESAMVTLGMELLSKVLACRAAEQRQRPCPPPRESDEDDFE